MVRGAAPYHVLELAGYLAYIRDEANRYMTRSRLASSKHLRGTMSTFPKFLATSERSFAVRTKALGPEGELPLTEDMLRHSPSGDIFGFSQDVGMGWDPKFLTGGQVIILSTGGGLRGEDGEAIALGLHTGHWELNLLVREAAKTLKDNGRVPFAVYCSDPCDGRTQGTDGMMDSLAYRNTAAEALGRLARSLPTRRGILGIATCDKGLPAMMMTLAEARKFPGILVPGGVTLPPIDGEDAGAVQTIGHRFAHGEISLVDAARLGCSACATAGGGCQFLGTAASSQVIGEALGMTLPHAALAPSGEEVWLELGRNSALALDNQIENGITMGDILSPGAIENAMVVHAAFGASTNLLLHLTAIAFNAGLKRPVVSDWQRVNAEVPRLVDVLPNGPVHHKTVQVFLAGGVPEVMLKLRDLGLLQLDCMTATGMTLGENLNWWEDSERRTRFRTTLSEKDGVSPADVILEPDAAKAKGMASTCIFPTGNLAPEGSVVKSTAIASELCPNQIFSQTGPARVFITEDAAIAAVRSTGEDRIRTGDIIVLICRGPLGAGMPETAAITLALKYVAALKNVSLITDGRFSGVTSGPCIGHVGPEALAGGPIGKLLDGDIIEIIIDRNKLSGTINVIGDASTPEDQRSVEYGSKILESRTSRTDLAPSKGLPAATRLWASLQQQSGGTWGGCVYDVDAIIERLATKS